ncbi:MAG: iron ABC transporter permease, partial [Rikenellaceae bacterium]|nr:iron ABC transporter permease [Rikenellaceae bacterium]
MSRYSLTFTLLGVGVVVVFIADLLIGSVKLPLDAIWAVITNNNSDELTRTLLLNFRLPKAIVAV